jgi:hypothetical protein
VLWLVRVRYARKVGYSAESVEIVDGFGGWGLTSMSFSSSRLVSIAYLIVALTAVMFGLQFGVSDADFPPKQ